MAEHSSWIVLGEGLLLLLVGGILLALWRSRQDILTRDAVPPALLTALALLLRCMAHAGPGDIRSVLDWEHPARAGWTVVLNLIRAVAPLRDETIWDINRIVGALSVPLLYVIMKRRFADPMVALGSATAVAVTPLIVRFSASDTPYILLCAALLGAVVAFDSFLESQRLGAIALAFGLLTLAMQLRPEAPWLIVPAVLLGLSRGFNRVPAARVLRPSILVCTALFVGLNAAPTLWALAGPRQGVTGEYFVLVGSLYGSPWTDPNTTPRPLAALVVLGACAAVFRHRARGVLWLAATLIALPLNAPAIGGPGTDGYSFAPSTATVVSQYANARYHIPAMYLACGLIGFGTAALVALLRRVFRGSLAAAPLVAVGVVCLAAAPRFDLLQRMWTPQREFEVFREGLRRIGPQCRVVTMVDTRDAGFIPFRYLAPQPLIDVQPFMHSPPPEGCVVYYRCANCYARDLVPRTEWETFEINSACRAIEERFELEPILEADVAALPFRGEVYARDPLPLGFYRMRERSSAPPGD